MNPRRNKMKSATAVAARTGKLRDHAAAAPLAKHFRWALATLFLATVLAYSSTLRAPFVYDDTQAIADNPSIRSLSSLTRALHPPPRTAVSGRPAVNLSLAVNYAVNEWLGVDQRADPDGPNKTVGYHVFNLLVHVLCGGLLFGLIRRTMRQRNIPVGWAEIADPLAFAVTAVWLLHPMQTEALNYIVQRTELMASACYLGTLYAALRAWETISSRARWGWGTAALLICAVGMASKEIVISVPLAVILYDRAFLAGSWKELVQLRRGRGWLYLALTAVVVAMLGFVALGGRGSAAGFHTGVAWYAYLYSQAWAIAHYLRLVVWPVGLNIDYGSRLVRGLRGVPGVVLLAAATIATLAAWVRGSKWLWAGFLGACFFAILAPSSSVVPVVTEIAAERRMYLPMAFVLLFIAVGIETLRRRGVFTVTGAGYVAALTPLAILLGGATFARGLTYASSETLWRDAIEKMPENPRAYDNLALEVYAAGPSRYEEADSLLQQAIRIDSGFAQAWLNLADLRASEHREPEAIVLLQNVLSRQPSNVYAMARLGRLQLNSGHPAAAIPYLLRAAQSNPGEDVLMTLGSAYMAVGKADSAAGALQAAIAINPDRTFTLGMLGAALTESGHPAEAEPYLERLTQLLPNSGLPFAMLGLNQAQLGHAQQADVALRTAIGNSGNDPQVRIIAGRALAEMKDFEHARQQFVEALKLKPSDVETLTRLGSAEASLGQPASAAIDFRRALAIDPGYTPARQALARLR